MWLLMLSSASQSTAYLAICHHSLLKLVVTSTLPVLLRPMPVIRTLLISAGILLMNSTSKTCALLTTLSSVTLRREQHVLWFLPHGATTSLTHSMGCSPTPVSVLRDYWLPWGSYSPPLLLTLQPGREAVPSVRPPKSSAMSSHHLRTSRCQPSVFNKSISILLDLYPHRKITPTSSQSLAASRIGQKLSHCVTLT